MPLLDIRTLLVLTGATVVFGTFALGLLWRGNRQMPGLLLLAMSCGFAAVGILLVALQQSLPAGLGIVVANTLIVLGLAGVVEGLRRFFGFNRALGWLVLLAVVTSIGYAWWTFVTPNLMARVRWGAGLSAVCCFYGTWVTWRRAEASIRASSAVIVAGLGVLGVLNGLRLMFSQGLFGADPVTVSVLTGTIFAFYAWILGVFMAVGERHLATAQLERVRAERGQQATSEFLAVMSHELRTPMNGVLGLTELLLVKRLEPEQRELVMSIRSSGRILLRILNDVLDLSKIEAGRLEIERVRFRIRDLVDQTLGLLEGPASAKPLQIRSRVAVGVPARVVGDPVRLGQVLLNLLGNAVKFTEQGHVELRVELAGSRHLRFEVEDTGIGIAEDSREGLFEAFRQSEASTTRRYGGTGLGLAISKRLVEMMGGQIEVASTLGRGSTFAVVLPLSLPDEDDDVPTTDQLSLRSSWLDDLRRTVARRSQMAGGEAPRILVVEDDPVSQLVATGMLEGLGCVCELAANGALALELLETAEYDLILMDCHMPTLDGFETTRQIRAREVAAGALRVPIVALTAGVLDEEKRHCLAVGMDDVLTKPVSMDTLASVLESWIGASNSVIPAVRRE